MEIENHVDAYNVYVSKSKPKTRKKTLLEQRELITLVFGSTLKQTVKNIQPQLSYQISRPTLKKRLDDLVEKGIISRQGIRWTRLLDATLNKAYHKDEKWTIWEKHWKKLLTHAMEEINVQNTINQLLKHPVNFISIEQVNKDILSQLSSKVSSLLEFYTTVIDRLIELSLYDVNNGYSELKILSYAYRYWIERIKQSKSVLIRMNRIRQKNSSIINEITLEI